MHEVGELLSRDPGVDLIWRLTEKKNNPKLILVISAMLTQRDNYALSGTGKNTSKQQNNE